MEVVGNEISKVVLTTQVGTGNASKKQEELRCKMNLWSNYTLVHSQPFSEICFHTPSNWCLSWNWTQPVEPAKAD